VQLPLLLVDGGKATLDDVVHALVVALSAGSLSGCGGAVGR
jgi:hypothetical protein